MATNVPQADIIMNDLNCLKFFKLLVEPCSTAFMWVYIFLYNWPNKDPTKLLENLDQVTLSTKILRTFFNTQEIDKINKMTMDSMKGFDISFYYKLIQKGTNSDHIQYPSPESLNLINHLYLVKEERNKFSHKDKYILNVTDINITDDCSKLIQRLKLIIEEAGKLSGIPTTKTDDICKDIEQNVAYIRDLKYISDLSIDRIKIINFIEQNYSDKFSMTDFENELKGYCPPMLSLKANMPKLKVLDLISVVDTQVTVINGKAGSGKTSLCKYLFISGLNKNDQAVKSIASFELVINICCRNIYSSEIFQLFEDYLPNVKLLIPATSILEDAIRKSKILWIIDGFNEATEEFKLFFSFLLQDLERDHKIILTTRATSLDEIDSILLNKSVSHVSMECLDEADIKQVAQSYLENHETREFLQFYEDLNANDDLKQFMRTPINLKLVLELWKSSRNHLVRKLLHKLYEKLFKKQKALIVDYHQGCSNVIKKSELKINVNSWFDQLCKLSSEIELAEAHETRLLEVAKNYHLDGPYCLSTFLHYKEASSGNHKYHFTNNKEKEIFFSHGQKK